MSCGCTLPPLEAELASNSNQVILEALQGDLPVCLIL